jgi:hypothetical protein
MILKKNIKFGVLLIWHVSYVKNDESTEYLFRIILINTCIVVFIVTSLMIVFNSHLNYLMA